VRRYIAGHPDTELIVVGRNSIEPHADITVLLDSLEPLPRKFYDGLERVIEDARKGPVRVRIFALRSARERK
jgi:hypothetical protein